MELEGVVKALNSENRREIIKTLEDSELSVKQIMNNLPDKVDLNRRESVYKAVEYLYKVGLVEKRYLNGTGIVYSLKNKKLILNLINEEVDAIE